MSKVSAPQRPTNKHPTKKTPKRPPGRLRALFERLAGPRRRRRAIRRLATALGVVALVAGAGYGRNLLSARIEAASADVSERMMRLAADHGLAVERVQVTGRERASLAGLRAALGLGYGDPILELDVAAARARIEALPWVAGARVSRALPDRIDITLTERRPLARWQIEGRIVVVDETGSVIEGAVARDGAQLPLVVGPGAGPAAPALLAALGQHRYLVDEMRAAVRIGGRRWDLRLEPHLTIRLPEGDVMAALDHLDRLQGRDRILERDVTIIDFRLPGELHLRLSPEAAERRRNPGEDA